MPKIKYNRIIIYLVLILLTCLVAGSYYGKPIISADRVQSIGFATSQSLPKEKQVTDREDISSIVNAINNATTSAPFVDASSEVQMQIIIEEGKGATHKIVFTENCLIMDSRRYKVDKSTRDKLIAIYQSLCCVETDIPGCSCVKQAIDIP